MSVQVYDGSGREAPYQTRFDVLKLRGERLEYLQDLKNPIFGRLNIIGADFETRTTLYRMEDTLEQDSEITWGQHITGNKIDSGTPADDERTGFLVEMIKHNMDTGRWSLWLEFLPF